MVVPCLPISRPRSSPLTVARSSSSVSSMSTVAPQAERLHHPRDEHAHALRGLLGQVRLGCIAPGVLVDGAADARRLVVTALRDDLEGDAVRRHSGEPRLEFLHHGPARLARRRALRFHGQVYVRAGARGAVVRRVHQILGGEPSAPPLPATAGALLLAPRRRGRRLGAVRAASALGLRAVLVAVGRLGRRLPARGRTGPRAVAPAARVSQLRLRVELADHQLLADGPDVRGDPVEDQAGGEVDDEDGRRRTAARS